MTRRGGAASGWSRPTSAGHRHPLAAAVALIALCLALVPLGPSVAAGDGQPGSRPSVAEVAGPRLGSAPRQGSGYRPANEPVAPRGDAGIIDTSDKDAVNTAYRQRYLQPRTVQPGWTGSVTGCRAGSVSAAFSAATLETVDYFRGLAGLPGVSLAARLNTPSQAAALIMDASNSLTHSPQPDAPCYTEAGRLGASKSNLALGAAGARAIGLYMHDYGTNNTAVGHRRWILYPPQTTLGSGSTTSADALYVLDTGTWVRPSDGPDWISWPPPGFVPYAHIYPRFSLSRVGADFGSASARVTLGGTALPATVVSRTSGYGDPAIVFEVDLGGLNLGSGPDRTFVITVDGVEVGGSTVSHQWRSTSFVPDLTDAPPVPTNVSAKAISPWKIRLSWDDGARETSYRVWRWNGTSFVLHADGLPAGSTTFVDSGLRAGKQYAYKVCALNSAGQRCSAKVTAKTKRTTLVIDDKSKGFAKRGSRWKASSSGYRRHSFWTNVRPGSARRSGTWTAALPVPGEYRVRVKIPRLNATTRSARYAIVTADGWVKRTVNQSRRRGDWVGLGTYRFESVARIRLKDRTGERAATGRRIAFDAVEFSLVTPSPAGRAIPARPARSASGSKRPASPKPSPKVPVAPESTLAAPTAAPPAPEASPFAKPAPKPDPEPTPLPTPKPMPANEPPTADAGGPYKVDEGDTVKLDGTGSADADGKIVAYAWTKPGRLDDPAVRRPVFRGTDDGKIDITLTVTDDDGASDRADATIKVRNVDPYLEPLAPLSVMAGEPLTLEVSFSDAGTRDTHDLLIDWGDGRTDRPALTEDGGAGSADARHAYADPGDYEVGLTLTDDDGGIASQTVRVSVENAEAATADS